MRNKFSKLLTSEYPPHGNEDIFAKTWKYAACMLLAFILGIGQMWAVDYNLINDNDNASTATLNTDDFWTAQSLQAKSNGGDLKKCIITAGTVSAGASNCASPTKHIQYDVKSTNTTLTIIAYNTNSSDLNITINEVKEAADGTISATNKSEKVVKKTLETITYSTTNTVGTKSTIYITVPSNATKIEFYQITASETGSALTNLEGGRVGYTINFAKKARLAAKGGEVSMLDGVEYKPIGDFKPSSTTYLQLKTSNYVKFKTVEPVLLSVVTKNAYQFYVAKTVDGTTYGANTAATHKFKLTSADNWYIAGGASSANQINSIAFDALYTLTYAAGTGSGSMDADYGYEDEEVKLPACTFTAPTSSEFNGWVVTKTASGDAVTVTKDGDVYKFTMPAEEVTATAQWAAATTKFDVTFDSDGGTAVATQKVPEGETASEPTAPTKDCYTFAGWYNGASPFDFSTNITEDVALTAHWTPNYAFGAYSFNALTVGTSPAKTINGNEVVYDDPFRVDNFYFDGGIKIQGEVGTDAEGLALDNFKGWKLKTTGKNIKFLVENNCLVKVAVGSANTLKVIYTALDGTEKNVNLTQQTETPYLVKGGTIVTLQTTTNSTITLKRIEISALYDATLTDTKSDGSDSKTSVAEVTLPTPTAVSGWTYTGWKADKDVIDSEDNTQTAGTLLAAGTYTLLDNTTFTAQWTEVTGTYDITYVSAHGTAPTAENAASVVLTELSEEGWAHKGWTANVDVTVDAATVNAGDLIENGKTVILAGDVTFTAVWKEIFTVTFDSKDGSAVAPVDVEDGASLAAAPTAPTKDNYVFLGWSETDGGPVVADITTLTIDADKTLYAKWALDVQITELVFSNSFKGWINGSNITVFYMAGESAPTIVSYDGKNLKAADAVAIVGDEVVAIGSDDSEKHYTLTMTAVSPLTAAGEQTFDGSETYVKTPHAWTSGRKWKMSKDGTDGRVPRGDCSMYFFLGAAESVTFNWGEQKVTNDVAVYVNGTFVKNIGKNNNTAIPLSGGNNMVAFYSLQTSGDIWLNGLSVVAYVPTTGVTLKEGEDAISSKTIWAGTNFTLTATVTPDNASDKTITWTSSDDAIATVVNGVVTGVAANATPATITATTVDGVSATCVVTVTAAPAPCETPTINTQPATQAYCAGSEPTLTVDAGVTDGGTLHYAWFKDDAAIGSDAATCLVDGAGTYKVVVTNHVDGKLDASVTSDNAVITLNVAAAITTQPANKSEIVSGSSVTLSLVATNATSYQWYSCDDAEKTNATAISGAEAADYVFTCTANGYYYCEVGNACGDAILSNVVSVKLEPEGCNTLASIPSAEPYQYEQAGEWTLYCVSSDGTLLGSNKFTDEGKDFDGNSDVNALLDKRFAIKFAKDVESVTIYAEGGTGRTFNKVYISSEMTKNTYSELEGVTKQMVNAETNRQYILTVTGIIPADQYAWFELSGSLGVFKICYSEALAKPTIPTLSNQELCVGEDFAEIDATSSKTGDGTLSYQWFNATDEENPVAISGATNAKYTPTADGKYYVEVTNAAAGHVSNKAKSNTITMAHFAAAEITTALENQRKDAGEEVTLAVVASGKNLHYAWKECATIDGTYTDVAGAADAASLNVTVPTGVKYYKVVVSSDCGDAVEAIAKVEEWTELPQLHINATTEWDLTTCADAEIQLTSTTSPKKGEECLMANIEGVHLDANFNSQALVMSGEYIYRNVTGKPTCAEYMKFITDVEGVVTITFAGNGSNRLIRVTGANGVQYSTVSTGTSDTHTEKFFVAPGEVELMGMNDAKTQDKRYMRFFNITFTAEPDYTRSVTEGRYGTICLPNGGVMVGATVFEVAYYGQTSEKIFFDEVLNGEMEAGVPYIFQPKEGASQLAVFYTDNAGETAKSVNGLVGFIGSGEDDEMNVPVGAYILNNNQYRKVVTLGTAKIKGYRSYINLNAITPTEPALAPGRRRISMSVEGTNTATGVDEIQGDKVQCTKVMINGQLFILRGEKLYDATGRLVK